jgi:putative ABC transport system permease protein
MPGVAQAANVTYLTMQVGQGSRDVRAMVVGITAGGPGEPGWPPQLVAGRQLTRGHYEAVADLASGFQLGDELKIRRNDYRVVGLTRRMVSSGGDPMVFIPLKDAQEAQFLKDNDAILMSGAAPAPTRPSTAPACPACWTRCRPRRPATMRSTRCWCGAAGLRRRRWPSRSGAGST